MRIPEERYIERFNGYKKLVEKFDRVIRLIGNLRLITFVSGGALAGIFYYYRVYYLSVSALVLFLFIFISLAVMHDKAINNRNYAIALRGINADSLKRITDEWHDFKDSGEDFLDIEHRYSFDLDIFGKGSLFQLINTACTMFGRERLAQILQDTPESIDQVLKRQIAVKELSQNLGWRQKLQSEGKMIHDITLPTERLVAWAEKRNSIYSSSMAVICFRALPALTFVMFFISIFTHLIPYYFYTLTLLIQIILLIIKVTDRSKILQEVYTYKDNIKAYSRMLEVIEKKNFQSEYLNDIKGSMVSSGLKPSKQIKKLEKIAEAISYRNSSIYIVLNVLFLWDYQCLIALEKWKSSSGSKLSTWLKVIAEFEALSSLAVLNHDHPEWCIPEISNGMPFISAKGIGHPLLYKAVSNDLKIEGHEKILLITGSNMSGKSTLLRTSGINLVLAYSGTAVCAEEYSCSLMNIYTCMRVSDNLEKNISSFYAEILRIRKIVKAADRGEKLYFLLDEIFKGTNSLDRHTGAKVLIKQLSRYNAIGLVSTHDLELGTMEKEDPKIKNYHFREYYENNELKFDYILRPGVSDTRNAMYLIRMAGIDTES